MRFDKWNKIHYLPILSAFFLLCSSNSNAAISSNFKNWELSVAGGFGTFHTDNTALIVSPFESDRLQVNSSYHSSAWKMGVGYSLLENLLIELNLYYTSPTITGDVWQYDSPLFNNYRFNAPLKSYRLMIDVKPTLFTICHVSPYFIAGVGNVWNTLSYKEVITNPDVDPTSNILSDSYTKSQMTYEAGFGIRTELIPCLSASLEYLYTDLGDMVPRDYSKTDAAMLNPPIFSTRNQSVLLGLNWKF